ncbi:aldehyde dehydrogenase family protein [Providencia sneebia]|uniref:Aldehyde dehydrogenase n=1 Tax=Providencia sneebia DSM 19967 TaxID=1141660 RepID=K8W8W8_9GAMM|nr:aldehyde dehydrogenase family protein [Providencia sneebia]EKT56321.1 aldehyde dehydrogenase [Providencia sneebia DSM 19967]
MSTIEEVVFQQKKFADAGIAKDISFRKKQLKKLKMVLQENENLLCDAIYEDVKKSKFETYVTELALIYHDIDSYIKHLDKWAKPLKVKTNIANLPGKSFIISEPYGTTLIIGAWNYPYQLTLAPLIAALAAGNTAIIKPSELPVQTSSALTKIINDNFEPGYLHVIEGGVEVTQQLLSYPYGKICFTGSTTVGKIVAKAAAEHLTPVLLELGGKSPCFVFEDADLKIAAKRIAWGKYLNAGQTCIAPDYLLVHSSVYDEFLNELKQQVPKIVGKNPLESDSYTRIINEKNVQRLKKLMCQEKLFLGGNIIESENYIEPTILKYVDWQDSCMQEEIFGPILPVLKFNDLNDVILKIKERPKPLALYVFSKSKAVQSKLLHEISFGGGCINDTIIIVICHLVALEIAGWVIIMVNMDLKHLAIKNLS